MIAARTWQPRREGFVTLFSETLSLPLIPLQAGTKLPIKGLDLASILHGRAKPEDTLGYFDTDPALNYAIPCLGGYFALDFDVLDDYLAFFPKHEELEARTMCVLSPHGGMHVWLKTTETVPRKIRFSNNLDILGVGGYGVGPGSVIEHPLCDPEKTICPHTGEGKYEIVESFQIIAAEALLPGASVLEAIRKWAEGLGWKVNEKTWPYTNEIAKGVPEGSRNKAAFTMARFLRHNLGMEQADALEALRIWNRRNQPPLPDDELRSVIGSVWSYAGATTIWREGARWHD